MMENMHFEVWLKFFRCCQSCGLLVEVKSVPNCWRHRRTSNNHNNQQQHPLSINNDNDNCLNHGYKDSNIILLVVVKVYVVCDVMELQLRWLVLATRDKLHFLGSCQGLCQQGWQNFNYCGWTCHLEQQTRLVVVKVCVGCDGSSTTVGGTCHNW